ncbi:hydroxyneurosporene synthase [Magnetospirillum fulvum MGU-K5]|uniref:Hydroxyneurosporene synthase n=1 Tax=Magnetospirillum fulvum MGU-K5 TaxID=1316936 RepID=S9TRD3_MAGFU|nr:hydroxyneurosporene synthase [Magnetospirillum fulvum MGU-K5]
MNTIGLRPSGKMRPSHQTTGGDRPAAADGVDPYPTDGLIGGGLIRPSELGSPDPGPLPCGRRFVQAGPAQTATGPLGLGGDRGPRFDRTIPGSGYSWWYIDALSDDGKHGLTLIFFIGSVFSPYYAWARRKGGTAEPLDHCSVNVCLYGATKRWSMTERNRSAVNRSIDTLVIGPSALRWTGSALEIRLSERTFPLPGRIQGTIKVHPRALTGHSVRLDGAGEHFWSPLAPDSRVEVELSHPRLRWSGPGYFDTNSGIVPLEKSFARWTWSRAPLQNGTAVLYDVTRRDGSDLAVALRIGRDGKVEESDSPPMSALPRGAWGVERVSRADSGHTARLAEVLEDTPFYTRSVIDTRLFGEKVTGFHESLCLDRFRSGWVQALLPFRMPRRFR